MTSTATRDNALFGDGERDEEDSRDKRYKQILYGQLGKNGISIITAYSFLMLLALLLVVSLTIGYMALRPQTAQSLDRPAILLPRDAAVSSSSSVATATPVK